MGFISSRTVDGGFEVLFRLGGVARLGRCLEMSVRCGALARAWWLRPVRPSARGGRRVRSQEYGMCVKSKIKYDNASQGYCGRCRPGVADGLSEVSCCYAATAAATESIEI
jgi:hypothetical protein